MKSEFSQEEGSDVEEKDLEDDGESEKGRGDMPILVCRDNKTGWYLACVVPNKGRCVHAAIQVCNVLDQLGYKKYILKTDQEPAILELKEIITRNRKDQVLVEDSAVRNSQSTGFIERAVQSIQ